MLFKDFPVVIVIVCYKIELTFEIYINILLCCKVFSGLDQTFSALILYKNLIFKFVTYEQVLEQPEARRLGGRVVSGITQRLAARFLQQILRVPSTASE